MPNPTPKHARTPTRTHTYTRKVARFLRSHLPISIAAKDMKLKANKI